MNRRRSSAFKKNLKDYMVPIVGLLLVLLLIISLLTWGDDKEKEAITNVENTLWLDVTLKENSECGYSNLWTMMLRY